MTRRVLCVISGDFLCSGTESYLEQVYKDAPHRDVQIDISVHGKIVDEERARRFENYGIRFLVCPVPTSASKGFMGCIASNLRTKGLIRRHLSEAMRKTRYDIVHVNSGWRWLQHEALRLAARLGVPVRISHSHVDNFLEESKHPFRKFLYAKYRRSIGNNATGLFACSAEAGAFMFGEREWRRRGVVAKTGISVSSYGRSDVARNALRGERSASAKTLVIGNVARLSTPKNHPFIVEVFCEVVRMRPDSQLWLVGDGEDRMQVESLIAQCGLEDKVVLWGSRQDVPSLLSGMDVFLFPSLHEGFGIAVVEAEAAGLPVACSDAVPRSVDIEGCIVDHLSLEVGVKDWAEWIALHADSYSPDGCERVLRAGFDSSETAKVVWRAYGFEDDHL